MRVEWCGMDLRQAQLARMEKVIMSRIGQRGTGTGELKERS